MMLAPHSERRRDAQNERDGAGLRISVVAATPSQQRLRRSSVAAALRPASAPSQQHQLRRGRGAQNERDGAGLRISVAAATPSQLRRSSAARTMSGRRGIGRSSPSGKFANFWAKTGVHHDDTTQVFNIILPKELRPLPCSGIFFFWVILLLKRAVFG